MALDVIRDAFFLISTTEAPSTAKANRQTVSALPGVKYVSDTVRLVNRGIASKFGSFGLRFKSRVSVLS